VKVRRAIFSYPNTAIVRTIE
jgi:hypothetical protein